MKKYLFPMLMLALFSVGFTASNEDDEIVITPSNPEDGKTPLDDYFTIENAVFHQGDFPESTDGSEFGSVTLNSQVLAGGANFITVKTEHKYTVFYLGIEGINGYLAYTPAAPTQEGNYWVYTIRLNFSITFNADITIYVCGKREDGHISKRHRGRITWVDSQSGDLNINLTFTTLKDVDLHLYLPDGNVIFYGNRGGINPETGESYGLDHDSNAGCRIDSLNNENIFIPASLVQNGTYRVVVNLYSNCDPTSGPTQWSVAARYKGALVTNELENATNPMEGAYVANAGRGDMTEAIRFTITNAQQSRGFNTTVWKPIPLTDMDQMKLEEASWNN